MIFIIKLILIKNYCTKWKEISLVMIKWVNLCLGIVVNFPSLDEIIGF